MNLKLINSLIAYLVILTGLVGCSNPTQTPKPEDISNSLVISYQAGPEIQIYGYIQALVKNTTSYCIVFPSDFGIRLFLDNGTNDTEIGNYTNYIGSQPILLDKSGEMDFISVGFDPDVSGLSINAPTKFFAEITGHLCADDSVIIKKKIPFVVAP